jgi:hypothetical protein
VHLVTAEIDGGRILAQARVPVEIGDTAETLHARIKIEEHKLLPHVSMNGASAVCPFEVRERMSSFTGTLNHQQREAATHIHGPLAHSRRGGHRQDACAHRPHQLHGERGHRSERTSSPSPSPTRPPRKCASVSKAWCATALGKRSCSGTFHAFCARLLREFASHVGYKNNFVIYSQGEQESLLKAVLPGPPRQRRDLRHLHALSRISKSKNDGRASVIPQKNLDAASWRNTWTRCAA